MMRYLIFLGLFFNYLQLNADDTTLSSPYEFESDYVLKREGSKVGEIKRQLVREGKQYRFISQSKTTGLVAIFYQNDIKESTTWTMQGRTFQPLDYEYFREKNGKQKQVRIKFDKANNKIVTYAGDSHWSMPFDAEIYDKLLYEIAIIQNLRNQWPIGEFSVADGGKLKTYRMENLGEEQLETAIGEFQTIILKRHKSNSDKTVTIWYAKELDYFPVKVVNVDGEGKTVTATISKLVK